MAVPLGLVRPGDSDGPALGRGPGTALGVQFL